MKIVTPVEVDSNILQSTNVSNIELDWAAGTIATGERRVYEDEVYEVVASPSTTDRPDIGAAKPTPTWVRLGFSNQWRMFRDGADSASSSTGDITVELEYGQVVSTIAGFGLLGTDIQVIVDDPVDGEVYNTIKNLVDIGVENWWEFYFLGYDSQDIALFDDLPPYPDAQITLKVSSFDVADPVEIGRVVAGVSRDVGVTDYGTGVRLSDYSTKERDGFGNLRLVPRRTLRIVDYEVTVETSQVDFVVRSLRRLAGVPTLFIGEDMFNSTVVFGVLDDASQGISTPSISDLTIRVEEF